MRKLIPSLLPLFLIASLLLAACGGSADDAAPGSTPELVATQVEPPAEFAAKTNPFTGDSSAASEGKMIYQSNCASCHGESAHGDGPAASSLDPKPQDLAKLTSSVSDGYLFWRISEGGMIAPFHSAMPGWKTILSEDQIWQLVAYLRELGG
jgi:mono/diheme cytochrome c family protein